MPVLWSFGCSHSSGDGLYDYIKTAEDVKQVFLKITDDMADNFVDAVNIIQPPSYYENNILEQWRHNPLFNPEGKVGFPDRSFAGRIAKKLGYEFKTYAKGGQGFDYIYLKFLEYVDEIRWDEDIVLIEIPPEYRYLTDITDKNNKTVQLALIDDPKQLKIIPSLRTLELLHTAIYRLIKLDYPKVKFINVYKSSEFQTLASHKTNISDEAEARYGKYSKLPCGHWINPIQELFADILIEEFNYVSFR